MTVRELFLCCDRDAVFDAIWRIYKYKYKRGYLKPRRRKAYAAAWKELMGLKPRPTKMLCVLAYYSSWHQVEVFGKKRFKDEGDDDVLHGSNGWSLSLTPWAEWLAMTVKIETPYLPDKTEVCAHILEEMTVHGYRSEIVQRFNKELMQRVEQSP